MRIWLMAARPRTLPAAVAPVLVGTSLAITDGVFHPLAFVAALLGAIFIQVGTNLSNDYSDARRGADTEDRLGPVRVTAGGLVPPRQVLMDGRYQTIRGIDVYWFVAEDQLTGSHWVRMRNSATHLLRTGELQRWAFVFCFTTCRPGEEKATYEHMCKFLAASVPEFQLTAGPRLAGQNATQTASEKVPTLPDGSRN